MERRERAEHLRYLIGVIEKAIEAGIAKSAKDVLRRLQSRYREKPWPGMDKPHETIGLVIRMIKAGIAAGEVATAKDVVDVLRSCVAEDLLIDLVDELGGGTIYVFGDKK